MGKIHRSRHFLSVLIVLLFLPMGCVKQFVPPESEAVSAQYSTEERKDLTEAIVHIPEVVEPRPFHLLNSPTIDAELKRYEAEQLTIKQSLERLENYKDKIYPIFERFQLPKELVAIAIVESNLDPHAESEWGQVGIWQFTKVTAEHYELKIGFFNDERRDVSRSTLAVAHYLVDLYKMFKDWPTVIAAYNAGSTRVKTILREAGTQNIFIALNKGKLPPATTAYMPKVFAVAKIINNPAEYGFDSALEIVNE